METVNKGLAAAEHYLSIGKPEKTLTILENLQPVEQNIENYWFLKSGAHYDLKQYERAARVAEAGLSRLPESVPLLLLLSECEAQVGNLAKAEKAILSALRIEPNNATLLSSYALIVARAGQLEKAELLLKEAARLEPENADVDRTRVVLSYLSGDDSKTILESKTLLADNPFDITGRLVMTSSLYESGKIAEGARHVISVAGENPTDKDFAGMAQEGRILSRWYLWPMRMLQRVGVLWVYIGVLLIIFTLVLLQFELAALIFAIVYFLFVIYTWVAPPLLEWYLKRRFR